MSERRPLILIADDEPGVRQSLSTLLGLEGMDALPAANGREALDLAASRKPDAVLLDLQMPVLDGMETLRFLQERDPSLPVIVLTGHGSIERAVEAVRSGAFDFLQKPAPDEKILGAIRSALRVPRTARPARRPREGPRPAPAILGESDAVKALRDRIARVAPKDATVLISGENGTGKELVAEAIHAGSPRAERPLVRVNCAAIPETLFESEVFGHERGAFTGAVEKGIGRFERATGGTLFLDEVGEIPLRLQAKLLRALQEGEIERLGGQGTLRIDVRVVAATNRDLGEAVASGTLREDLYYRLNVIPIHVPPLRERIDDLPLLARHFFGTLGAAHAAPGRRFDDAALKRLESHPFPGNIRELRNLVERCVVLSAGDVIGERELLDLAPHLFRASRLPVTAPLKDRLLEAEREMVRDTLERTNWRMTRAAEVLGLERSHLYKKLRALGIERPREAGEEEPEG